MILVDLWLNLWIALSANELKWAIIVNYHMIFGKLPLKPNIYSISWYRSQCLFIASARSNFWLLTLLFFLSQNGLPRDCHSAGFSAQNKWLLRLTKGLDNKTPFWYLLSLYADPLISVSFPLCHYPSTREVSFLWFWYL